MTVVVRSTYGGMDWHDRHTQDEPLKGPDGSYDIKDVDAAIAADIFKEASEMEEYEYGHGMGDERICKLQDVPGYDSFLHAVKTGEELEVHSPVESFTIPDKTFDGDVVTFDYTLMSLKVSRNKSGGVRSTAEFSQVTYYTDYIVREIPDENVRYIPVENFLVPWKGVPCVQRFYQEPFRNLEEAEAALEEMELHTDGYETVKELHIVDIEKILESEWYKANVAEFGKPFSLQAFNPWIRMREKKAEEEKRYVV